MALYTWQCVDCKHEMELDRPMAEYDRGPDEGCEKCKSKNVERIIKSWSKQQFIKVHGGTARWHDEEYLRNRSIT